MTPLIFALLLLQEKASIEGKVVNARTNEPLRKVLVTMDSVHRYSVTTGVDGTFRFESVEPDDYEPIASRTGFLEADEEDWFEVGPGEHKKDVVIRLMPQGVIAGHVVDEDGDPVPQVSVKVERAIQIDGKKKMLDSSWETSNSEGYFYFGGLRPGTYYVNASQVRRFQHGPRLIDASDSLAETEPQPLHLTPGSELRNLEIRMKKAVAFRVSGEVSNPAVNQPSLYLTSESGDNGYTSQVTKGQFVFEGVVPGSYVLTVSPLKRNQDGSLIRAAMYCRIPVVVGDRDVNNLAVELTPGSTIQGSIKIDGGEFAKPPRIDLQVFGARLTADVKEDGSFAWTNISPDQPFLMYDPPEGSYVKSVMFNQTPVTDSVIDLRSGGGTLEIIVSPKAATISATVEGANNVYIGLWNESGFFRQKDTAVGDTVEFKNLGPGEYRIAAYGKFAAELMGFDEFRRRFEAQKVTVAEGSSQNIEVKLIPKSAIDTEIAKLQ